MLWCHRYHRNHGREKEMANGAKCREEVRQDKNQQYFICLFIKEFIDREIIG